MKEGDWSRPPRLLSATTILLFLLLFIRILRISNGHPETALAVVASSGPATVVIGSVIPLIPVGLPFAVVLFAGIAALWTNARKIPKALGYWGATLVFTIGGLFVSPRTSGSTPIVSDSVWATIFFLVASGLLAAVVIIGHRMLVSWEIARRDGEAAAGWWLMAVVWLFVFWSFQSVEVNLVAELDKVWLPTEVVSTSDGREILGYVLDDDIRWMSVLTEPGRVVVKLEAEMVVSREICTLSRNELSPPPIASENIKPSGLRQCSSLLGVP